MLYQIIVAGCLLGFLVNLILNLRSLKLPSAEDPLPEPAPLISVLIPARDEETNIGKCLASLQQQDYPNYEVLVLDDNSSDDTAAIVSSFAAGDKRIRLIHGQPLAHGWTGKSFACHQLAAQARGSWLLFTDADTIHAPNMLRSVLPMAIKTRASLLSGFPRQLANSWLQRVVTPIWQFIIMSWMPLWALQYGRKPKAGLAIGQFLLFPKEEYWRIGGHRAVRAKILEDVWFGIETTRKGGRHVVVDLSNVVSTNMYPNLGATWKGLARSIYSVIAISPAALVGLIIAAWILYMAPFYTLWNDLFVLESPRPWLHMVVFQVVIIIVMRLICDIRFKNSVLSSFLHPIAISFLFLDVLYAGGLRIIGQGTRWKDRVYEKSSGIE